ncbi:hypothetical protein ACH5RR_026907 [Cinchona calisaya]|uniref:F-box domain-containing protein n=1 Tax=Cinchona calisaya TaxID=153742 RepID=A0ABD2Z3X9_9GENT
MEAPWPTKVIAKDWSNLPEEMINQILFRCPYKSIFRFKCVSKTWNRNLSDPLFGKAYVSLRTEIESPVVPPHLHVLGFFRCIKSLSVPIVRLEDEPSVRPLGRPRSWELSKLVAVDKFGVFDAMVSNNNTTSVEGGTFLWFSSDIDGLIAYDPKGARDRVQMIQLPSLSITNCPPSLCQSRKGFLQCAVDVDQIGGFGMYTLARTLASYGYDEVILDKEWSLTYSVRFNIPDAIWIDPTYNRVKISDKCVIRIGFHLLNPLIVIFRMGNNIYTCDVENGGLNLIPYKGYIFPNDLFSVLLPCVLPYWPTSPQRPKGIL